MMTTSENATQKSITFPTRSRELPAAIAGIVGPSRPGVLSGSYSAVIRRRNGCRNVRETVLL
jgi:hypothetical protein